MWKALGAERRKLLAALILASAAGFALGVIIRSLVLRGSLKLGNGLRPSPLHLLLGSIAGYFYSSMPLFSLLLTAFYTFYQLGEWVLGDEPWGELEDYGLGAVMGLLARLASKRLMGG